MFNYLKLDLPYQEIIIDLLDNKEEKEKITLNLFIAYRDGAEDEKKAVYYAPDEGKADYYLGKYLLIELPDNYLKQGFTFFSWFTTLRLCELRINRYWTQIYSKPSFLPLHFTVLQLSYFPETVYCIYKLIVQCFRPRRINESFWTNRFEWNRCKQILSEREFLGAFSNAAVWLIVNSVCFFYYLGKSNIAVCLWNLGGFFFDILHDYILVQTELNQYVALLNILDPAESKENTFNIESRENTPNIVKKLEEKICLLKIKKWRVTLVAVGIFTGMFFFYAPILFPVFSYPTLWKAFSWIAIFAPHHTHALTEQIKNLGAGILLVFGTIIGNLGGRIIRWEEILGGSLWRGNFLKKIAAPFFFIWQVVNEVGLFLYEFLKAVTWNHPDLLIAGILTIILLHVGAIAAIPLIGNDIMGFGLPTVFTLTCLTIKNLLNGFKNSTLKWLEVSFESELKAPPSGVASTALTIESLKRNEDELKRLQKSARLVRLRRPALLKHIRNWKRETQENKESLSYNTEYDLIQAARRVKQISFFKQPRRNGLPSEAQHSEILRPV